MRLLFIINPRAGKSSPDYKTLITEYLRDRNEYSPEFFELPPHHPVKQVKELIRTCQPHRVIAVGGDGTVRLVAECVCGTDTSLGIIPGGSANGMARELDIPALFGEAMETVLDGQAKAIHALRVNDEFCIHLADIGFNAFVIKKFESAEVRGMWGYVKAAWKVLWQHSRMRVLIETDKKLTSREAVMVVIANARQYGTGAVINPKGNLEDELFEVVVVKKISVREIFKMRVSHKPYDRAKVELFRTSTLEIESRKRVHFQVDGEYLGKVNKVKAEIIPEAILVMVPEQAREMSKASQSRQ